MDSLSQVVEAQNSQRRVAGWRPGIAPHRYGLTDLHLKTHLSVVGKADPGSNAEKPLQQDVSSRFGRRLRELRRDRFLTQASMAKKFGIDRSFISDVERGRKSISLPMLEVLALGLEISLSELFQNL